MHSLSKTDGDRWCGSSAWLEYMPVTHGVAGSSPVRTAKEFTRFKIKNFCIIKRVKRRNWNEIAIATFFYSLSFRLFTHFMRFNPICCIHYRKNLSANFLLQIHYFQIPAIKTAKLQAAVNGFIYHYFQILAIKPVEFARKEFFIYQYVNWKLSCKFVYLKIKRTNL